MLTRRTLLVAASALAVRPLAAWARVNGSGLPYPLFDAHAHLKSDDLNRYPRAQAVSQPPGETPEVVRVLRWMDQNGVGSAAAVQHRGTYGTDNRYLLDSTDQYRTRLVPVVALDAEDPKTPELVRQLIGQHGLAGLRLTGTRGGAGAMPWLNSANAHRTWTVVNEAGLAMDLMTLPPGPAPGVLSEYARLAEQYPQARLVLDHCGWPIADGPPHYGLDDAYRALIAHRNIYFKFTTVNLEALRLVQVSARDALRHYVSVFGAERLLWGSDIGNSAGSYAQMVNRIVQATAAVGKRERRQLLHDTAEAVFVAGGRRV